MDDSSRAVGEVLSSDLECPVCMEYMVPPIKLCTNGHNICSKCSERVAYCPTCRARLLETRNVTLENIVRRQKFPCVNRQSGCLEFFSVEHIAKHQAVCVYGKIKCPLHMTNECSWNGLKNDLKGHAKLAHTEYFLGRSTFRSPSLTGDLTVVSCFGELFTYRRKKKDGRNYAAVQLVGSSSEASKYKCEFALRAVNGIEQISTTCLVQGYTEDWETIFNSGKCLIFEEVTARNFVEGNNLNLTVTLSTV
jgi:hypothetical protein